MKRQLLFFLFQQKFFQDDCFAQQFNFHVLNLLLIFNDEKIKAKTTKAYQLCFSFQYLTYKKCLVLYQESDIFLAVLKANSMLQSQSGSKFIFFPFTYLVSQRTATNWVLATLLPSLSFALKITNVKIPYLTTPQ